MNTIALRPYFFILGLFVLLIATGCARSPKNYIETDGAVYTPQGSSRPSVQMPLFLVKEDNRAYNRIGKPSVRQVNGAPQVYVDPGTPLIFFEEQRFATEKAKYTNLVYRVHFEQVPLSWSEINLTAGNNPGLLVIYTLDDQEQILLVTTVHTCGCFLAFLPTSNLQKQALPPNWPDTDQWVYGYTLPAMVDLPVMPESEQIIFTLESQTHRIAHVEVIDGSLNQLGKPFRKIEQAPMDRLYTLPYGNETVSFFEIAGEREGYVKNNRKILEKLLVGWWAFDFKVGEDKAFSNSDNSETIFYTSLKFWDRKASDMKDFPNFLKYWGWGL